MAVLTPATSTLPCRDDSLNRLPSLSNEAPCSRSRRNLPLFTPGSKQQASFRSFERPPAWRVHAVAASAPRADVAVESVTDLVGEVDERDQTAAAEASSFDWSSHWYPVSLTDDLDKRVPTAIAVMGRHLVVSWSLTEGSWEVRDEVGSRIDSIPYGRSSGDGNAQSFSSRGSLECRPQVTHASVYPSIEQDGVLWFWPHAGPEFKRMSGRKPPPSIPALTDPEFKDKLFTMNLPYGYKKMIENLLEPACLPFAHDELEVDFLEDFEESLTNTASQLNKPISSHANNEKQEIAPCSSETSGQGKFVLSGGNAVVNGASHAKRDSVEKSFAPRRCTTFDGQNDRVNAQVKTSNLHASDCTSGSSNRVYGQINGSHILKGVLQETQQNGIRHSSINFPRKDGDANEAEVDVSKTFVVPKSGRDDTGVPVGYERSHHGGASDCCVVQARADPSKWAANDSIRQSLVEEMGTEESSRDLQIKESGGEEVTEPKALSSVVIKKPSSSARTKFDEKFRTTVSSPNISSKVKSDDVVSDSSIVSSCNLESSLQDLRQLIYRKDYELAKARVEELYSKYPHDTGVLMEYAFVEKQLGDLVAAGALYSKAITAFEDKRNLGYDYVRALQALGSIEARARNVKRSRVLFMESIHAARQAEQRFPDLVRGASVYGLHAWAQLELQQGNWAKARDLLARAADVQPGNAVVHQSRALLEARAHNWKEARHHFSLAVETAPDDVKCWHAWAMFEARQKNVDKMRELFQKALGVDPYSIHCLQAWAHQETVIGTPEAHEKARSLFQRSVQVEPRSLYSWQAWAVLEKNLRNYDKARELFNKCLELNSSSVACLQALANMERHLKSWGTAQRLLRKALKLEPENAAVLMEAALVEKCLGNTEVAERLFVLAGMADKRTSRVTNRIFASRKEVMPERAGKGRKGALIARAQWKSLVDSMEKIFDNPVISERKPIFLMSKGGAIESQEDHDGYSSIQGQSGPDRRPGNDINDAKSLAITIADKAGQTNSVKDSDEKIQPCFHLNQRKRNSIPFQFAIDAIQEKLQENSGQDKQRHSQTKQHHRAGTFQFAIDAIKAKQRELKSREREHTNNLIDGDSEYRSDDTSDGEELEALLRKSKPIENINRQPFIPLKQDDRVPSMMGA